jgi:ATP-dependent exoDNAse (exonuclease V) alpha subunit
VKLAKSCFPICKKKLGAVASTSRTIHSLLGHHPGKNSCTYHAGHRLPFEILIVDECSMIDTLLWKALLESLRDDARLILLGDPNQLESVGRGNVFSEIARSSAMASARVHLAPNPAASPTDQPLPRWLWPSRKAKWTRRSIFF